MCAEHEQHRGRGGRRARRAPLLRVGGLLLAVSAALLASGCSGGDNHQDLKRFVKKVEARPGGRIAPIPEFKTYQAYTYTAGNLRDPFVPARPEAQLHPTGKERGPRPDVHRHKEALEAFPLDTLKYVGSMSQQGERWAVISAPDGLVYRVQVGNHIGQNYGKIVKITDTKLYIKEIVPNGQGGWVERNAALSLTE